MCTLGTKTGFYLTYSEKIGKIEKMKKFQIQGILMNVYIGFWCFGQTFIPKFKQKSHKGSIFSFCKIWKIGRANPPLCKNLFFNTIFLMSHVGVIHRGPKLAKSKRSVPHHLCALATMSLKICIFPLHFKIGTKLS